MQSREQNEHTNSGARLRQNYRNYGSVLTTHEDTNAHLENNVEVLSSRRNIPCSLHKISTEYESLDYDPSLNSLWSDERRERGIKFVTLENCMRWIVCMFIGIITAFIAFFIDFSITTFSFYKFSFLQMQTERCLQEKCLFRPFITWLMLNGIFTLLAVILGSYIEPVSVGSGIPQVKCYLNGVKVPRVVRVKTLLCKVFGIIFSVLGGLCVGKEGPMIHSGAVVAAGISQGTSSTFGWDFGIFKYFRNDSEKRDFVSAGAAAGVAAAFGAPVGGVLFALEEGSSFWKQMLTWRVFFSALISCFTLNFFLSLVNGDTGDLSNPGLLNLGKFNDLSYRFFEFIPFLFIGVFEGLLGSLFNFINYKLTVIRMRYLSSPFLRIAEALFVSQLTTLCSALMIYFIQDCRKRTSSDGIHIQMFCKDGEESTVALLLFQTPEACVRSLFHDPNGSFNWSTVIVFFFVYFFLACGTYGLGVPSGLFIPTLLTGAAFGRICGMVLRIIFPNQEWVDEGKYALVGAAAGLAGVVRMTISLTVILMECVGNITFGLPLMIVVVISKFVGDFFNEGLYDIHIKLSGIPLIPWEPPILTDNIFASEIMSLPVITLQTVESTENIYNTLKRCNHNGFPVVDLQSQDVREGAKGHGKLRGLILRSDLIILLKNKIFNENTHVWDGNIVNMELFRAFYPRYPSVEEVSLSEEELGTTIDLRPFMNPSPYTVTSAASFQRIFHLFRGLGLRHLIVLNDEHRVVGIITRKDIVKFHFVHERGGVSLIQLEICDAI
ncbi:UNVERIFIED_CONTAM: hypothetical protein RMT77_010761 [Armadillidium vulgare]